MKRTITSALLLAALTVPALGAGDTTADWFATNAKGANFKYGLYRISFGETQGMAEKQALRISRNPGVILGWTGRMKQTIPATAWRGKRLRLSLRLKGDAPVLATAWLDVSGAKIGSTIAMENYSGAQWKTCQLVLDVPVGADEIIFGIDLPHRGSVWMDSLSLAQAPDDVPVNDSRHGEGGHDHFHPLPNSWD